MIEPTSNSTRRRTVDYAHVLIQLEALCSTLPTGARVPTHTKLMQQLGASERAVLRALDELCRSGRVVRRNGAGTFIAERSPLPDRDAGESNSQCIVALAEPSSFFFDRCVADLFRYTDAEGISLICHPIQCGRSYSHRAVTGVHPSHGYLLNGHSLAPLARQLQEEGCRVVMIGMPPVGAVPEVPCVYSDLEHGGYLAVRHLLDLGHRRIAFCGGTELEHSPIWRGGQRALQEARRAEAGVAASMLDASLASAWAANPAGAAEFFRRATAPTALLAGNDREALLLHLALARAGVRVPEEVSLVGFGELREAEPWSPSLTMIDHALCQQLQAALRLLTSPVPPPRSHATLVVPTLICRESTCAPNVG